MVTHSEPSSTSSCIDKYNTERKQHENTHYHHHHHHHGHQHQVDSFVNNSHQIGPQKVPAFKPHHLLLSRHLLQEQDNERQSLIHQEHQHKDLHVGARNGDTASHHHHQKFKAFNGMTNDLLIHKGRGDDGHRFGQFEDNFHNCAYGRTCSHASSMYARRGHISSHIGIDAHDLARRTCDSPISFRGSSTSLSSSFDGRTSSKISNHSGKINSFLDRHYKSEGSKVRFHSNPMLFHPRFNNVDAVQDDDDYNSFQALRKCRYLRIPKRLATQEIESAVD